MLDNLKVFFVNRSDLLNRLQPKFYTKKYVENLEKIYNSSHSIVSLDKITSLISDGTHFTPTYVNQGVKFISVKDVRKGIISLNDPKFITEQEADILDKRCKPQKDDVLLTKIGATFGYASVVTTTERFQIFVSLALLRPKKDLLEPKYLELLLNSNLVYVQFERVIKGAGVPDLHLEDIRKVKIPLPNQHIQKKIINMWELSLNKVENNRAQSNEKLISIDAYLLEKLDVEQEQKKSNVESRIFKIPFRNLVGKRFDPIYYNSDLEQFNKGNFRSSKLKALIKEYSSGQGVGRQDQVSEEEGIIQIRPTNLGSRGSFLFQKNVFVPDEARHKRLQKGDVIFNNTNSQELVGKSAYWDIDSEATYSNHITVLRVNETKILPEYLALILNLYQKFKIFYSICTNWNNQSGVGIDVLLDLNIPLPPLAIQEEIISHIQQICDEAKKLEDEASLVLEKAKQEIEKMILGETV